MRYPSRLENPLKAINQDENDQCKAKQRTCDVQSRSQAEVLPDESALFYARDVCWRQTLRLLSIADRKVLVKAQIQWSSGLFAPGGAVGMESHGPNFPETVCDKVKTNQMFEGDVPSPSDR